MDPRHLKDTYGDRITFWGGGVDTQKVLSFGTEKDVKIQVEENLRIFGENGGYVFNTVHNIQANVPPRNLIAMLETIKKVNG
jgi:uroporphyrinogen-III decarboxylase